MTKLIAKIILARCPYAENKTENVFGMRIQKFGSDWKRTWAFKIELEKAEHEGYNSENTSGTFNPTSEYPGCPYCHSFNLAKCQCGKSFCFKRESKSENGKIHLTCPWCGLSGDYCFAETLDLTGGGF